MFEADSFGWAFIVIVNDVANKHVVSTFFISLLIKVICHGNILKAKPWSRSHWSDMGKAVRSLSMDFSES